MTQRLNGALLALGVVGAVALAGRVARGSFNTDGIRAVLKASKRDDSVDSGDLVELLEQVRDSEALHSSSREMARELLDRSEEDEYLDTGEAIEVLEHALREAPKKSRGGSNMGSLAQAGVNKEKTDYRSLYHGHRKKAHNLFPWNLGGPLDYQDDNRRRQLSARAPANKQGRAGGSRAVGVDAHNPKSRAEYIAYLDDLAQRARDGRLTLDEDGRWSFGVYPNEYDHHTTARKMRTAAALKNIATEREWISTWPDRNPGADRGDLDGGGGGSRALHQEQDAFEPSADALISDARGGGLSLQIEGRHIGIYKDDGPSHPAKSFQQAKGRRASRSAMGNALVAFREWCDKHQYYPNLYWMSDHGNIHGPISPRTGKEYKRRGGSRAFTLDDPEYTHYVVHKPSMKIASGWSYPEDAKDAIDDMGPAKAHCRVYTRKYLRDNGRDPRHNGSWASRGQF
jgi:hypothetical protein